jgi:hypothetical protein
MLLFRTQQSLNGHSPAPFEAIHYGDQNKLALQYLRFSVSRGSSSNNGQLVHLLDR